MMDEKELKEFLADSKVSGVIRKSLEQMMHAAYTTHRIIERPELAHVDSAILDDLRQQGYSLFERASGCNLLLGIIIQDEATDYIRELFAQAYLTTTEREESFRTLIKTVLSTYAPKLAKELIK